MPEEREGGEIAEAGLIYASDGEPGIRRRRAGRGFCYRGPDGTTVGDARTLSRIRQLAIPPAYRDVWICTQPRGHLQATGRDARGRKQYRYHPRWRTIRDETKFARIEAFAAVLPAIRAEVARDLARPGLPKRKLVAALVRLLEDTHVRIGNDEYAEANGSFGLTTLRKRHADVVGAEIQLAFRAKSGKPQRVSLLDRRLARIVRTCQELPGQRLFQAYDDDGNPHPIGSEDVNQYIREIAGDDFSAKDFRTWAGTRLAVSFLTAAGPPRSAREAVSTIVACMRHVAERLGNTPAVTRKCYVHPAVVAAYEAGALSAEGEGEAWVLSAVAHGRTASAAKERPNGTPTKRTRESRANRPSPDLPLVSPASRPRPARRSRSRSGA